MTAARTDAAAPATLTATLIKGDKFILFKSGKEFLRGAPKAVTKEEMDYLSEHAVEIRTLPAYDQDDDGKVATRLEPKFVFSGDVA